MPRFSFIRVVLYWVLEVLNMEKIFILFIVLAAFIILIRMLIRNIKNGGCGTCAGGCASMSKKCKDKNK